ncbi:hypothetical protein HD806DRAFT_552364 [Xylariaceae sp. AK1471]|nr:hypothetical protein HD806DRAFT_552364 [Xylariaceae sp. AK1471]
MTTSLAELPHRGIVAEASYSLTARLGDILGTYTLAQQNPELFPSWCDDQGVQGGSLLPKGGNKSVVQHRFADLIFSHHGGSDDMKRRTAKIQMWRKNGKKWTQLIRRFGYGILLLLPPSLSDEDLRVTHDKVLSCVLDLIESRKPLFADIVQRSNNLLAANFFPQDEDARLINAHSSSCFEEGDWNSLLNAPVIRNQKDNGKLRSEARLSYLQYLRVII